MKICGEYLNEIVGVVIVLLENVVLFLCLDYLFVDIVGIGGDGSNSINIFIVSAFVVVVCGLKVVKYGNCSVFSKFGLFDLLVVFGINFDMNVDKLCQVLDELGVCFFFVLKYYIGFCYVMLVCQ